MRSAVLLAVLAACGGGGHAKPDAPVADASPDAPPDATIAPAHLTAIADGQSITEWTFADTATGATSAITMLVRNDGGSSVDLAVALATTDYAIDAAGSTCDDLTSLAPGAYCHVRLTFAPTAAGAHDAMLALATGSAPFAIPLHGMGSGPPGGLSLTASSVDFGVVYTSQAAGNVTVLLANNGSSTATVDSIVVAGSGFQLVSQNCPSSLTPGGACSITLGFLPTTEGARDGSLTVTSGTTQLAVKLTGLAARLFTIETIGAGTGTVTSMPDVQCGAACIDNAFGTVVLTEMPASGSVFAGWNNACGTNTMCTIDPGGPVLIQARFEDLTAKSIAITIAGTGSGFVFVNNTICTTSCTTYVGNGTSVVIYGYTPSKFSGWTGDCTSTTNDCNLGTVISNRAATVTFDRDDREVTTLYPKTRVTGLAMTPDGDLVIANANGVSRMTLAGVVVWTTAVANGPADLTTDAAGNIYGLTSAGVFSLTSAGAPRWTRSFAVAPNKEYPFESMVSTSPDGTVIAAHTSDGAHVVDGAGTDLFTVTGLTSMGMAVAPDGTVAIGTSSTTLPPLLDVHRYDRTGAALATLSALPDEEWASLIYDSQGYLCSQTDDSNEATVSRFAPDLQKVFSTTETLSPAQGTRPPQGIAIDSNGELVAARGINTNATLESGLRLEVFSPTGTST